MSNQNIHPWGYSLPAALALMVPFDLLASLAMDVYLPVVPHMPAALNTSTLVVQLSLSLYILILGLGQLIFGPLSDRIGRRPVVLGGAAAFTMTSFCIAMVNRGDLFLALRVIQALGASAALVGVFSTIRDVYGNRPESSTIYGLLSSILAFVPAIGPIIGAALAINWGWRSIFYMLGLAGLLSLLRAWPKWHETRWCSIKASESTFASILASSSFWVYTLGFSTAMGSFFVFFSIAPRVLIEGAGFSQLGFSFAFSTVAVIMIITARFSGWFVGRWGIQGCFVRGTTLIALGSGILAVCSVLGEPQFATFVVPMWVIAVGIVMLVSITANGALREFDDMAGTAVALYFGVQGLVVSGIGTGMVLVFGNDNPWSLIFYAWLMCLINICGFFGFKKVPD
ncbi:CmlA/FloR family chloramphenicol efflux MFS transporter [Photorhabdus sp. CRCIA-P01]|uniref:CmlA/FloR family chloramphenicol efflux MFS transporter n=1 Tax=Photorhabdus sp. CRCIA-P01 TaxID=2019570 RepID=UPI000E5A066D|nr:CmlA/FloR family chloramphenicol efflux MFS transporter [Photorhabdus sp. CRCIA-P01]